MPDDGLIFRTARFWVLAEQASGLMFSDLFWNLSIPPAVKTADRLPAMAAAVRRAVNLFSPDIPGSVTSHHLPHMLPPEAVPWLNDLVAAWEVHRTSNEPIRQNIARRALVRLDGCGMPDGHERPSRLPEWLADVQKIAGTDSESARTGEGRGGFRTRLYRELPALRVLAALAAWRSAPRVLTPPETLRAWVDFWRKLRQSGNPVKKGLAAIALLNLPEAALRAAGIPRVPGAQLLKELAAAIPVAVRRTVNSGENHLLLLDWQPVTGTTWPATEVRKVADAWLEITRHRYWRCRYVAWQQLIRWDGAGSLAICGMDLLPELVKALQTEEDWNVLGEMAQWVPTAECLTATKTPSRCSQLQELEEAWKRQRASWCSKRAYGWLAGIHLHQAGLASEPPESFLQAYLSRVAGEKESPVLFILAQWSPGAGVPGMWHQKWKEGWQQRLLDENERIRQIAAFALLRQSLENGPDRSLRGTALELWRAGTKTSSEASQRLGALFARFQEVRARLAVGEVVDFEEKPVLPAKRSRPPLALPPGRIVGSEWSMANGEQRMASSEWRMANGSDRF